MICHCSICDMLRVRPISTSVIDAFIDSHSANYNCDFHEFEDTLKFSSVTYYNRDGASINDDTVPQYFIYNNANRMPIAYYDHATDTGYKLDQ